MGMYPRTESESLLGADEFRRNRNFSKRVRCELLDALNELLPSLVLDVAVSANREVNQLLAVHIDGASVEFITVEVVDMDAANVQLRTIVPVIASFIIPWKVDVIPISMENRSWRAVRNLL